MSNYFTLISNLPIERIMPIITSDFQFFFFFLIIFLLFRILVSLYCRTFSNSSDNAHEIFKIYFGSLNYSYFITVSFFLAYIFIITSHFAVF